MNTYKSEKYNLETFHAAVSLFKKGSYFNSNGVYKNYKLDKNFKSIIDLFYPLLKNIKP